MRMQDVGNNPAAGDLVRSKAEGTPIYIFPQVPFWFVPTPEGDEILRLQMQGAARQDLTQSLRDLTGRSAVACELDLDFFLRSIEPPPYCPHNGRDTLELDRLLELWIHLTDSCNLRCRHCLFETAHSPRRLLSVDRVKSLIQEACGLDCRLVCFTGGEPFTYPDFPELLRNTLTNTDLHVAVLTNGVLIPGQIQAFRMLDLERIHFQVSLDGPEAVHDSLRGKGAFQKTVSGLKALTRSHIPCSIAMAVNAENLYHMDEVVRLAHDLGVQTVHFLWHLPRAAGKKMERLHPDLLVNNFRQACTQAGHLGISIDNLEAMRAQVFSPAGTRFDMGNAAWECLAVGPDGSVYPSAATVDLEALQAGRIEDGNGIENVWRQSPLLCKVRSLTLAKVAEMKSDPWRFILGGGDLDHCLISMDGREDIFNLQGDPYAPLYHEMVKMLIAEEVETLPVPEGLGLILRMGDVTTDCPSGKEVNFTHNNCLLSVGEGTTKGLVRQFYDNRAIRRDEAIVNPVFYDEDKIAHIPQEARVRLYGCGSPVEDAHLRPGEVVVDLGCGTGVECFIAAKEVGGEGRAIGVDMSDAMLDIARRSRPDVQDALGYANTAFLEGYLEAIPLADKTADLVISNCVVNLNHHKRRVFQEIFRILKPGGRLVISDVVTETEPPVSIRGDHQLIGECIGGAMVQDILFAMLRDLGFVNASILKRFPYRTVQGHRFYSLTFCAWRPTEATKAKASDVLYAGPFRAVVTEEGVVLPRGASGKVNFGSQLDTSPLADAGVLILDPASGAVKNAEAVSCCACALPQTAEDKRAEGAVPKTGCLVCGAPLVYPSNMREKTCVRCGLVKRGNAVCEKGHFVCDACHIQEPQELIRKVCATTGETDMLRLLRDVRSHAGFPIHGPEHHALVPGVILACYRNLGGEIADEDILRGIEQGALVPGGSCAFMGICGAAVGVGIAFAVILGSTPLTPKARQDVQRVVSQTIGRLAGRKAARCCQRESFLALKEAARRSEDLLPVALKADERFSCEQHLLNQECIKATCPLYPAGSKGVFRVVR